MNTESSAFIKLLKHPLRSGMFLFLNLPSAFFAGVRIKAINESSCEVTVPYKWFTKNPFRSTYFACLSMAAEMSTGVLCLVHLYKRKPAVSMLVTKVESEYFKKATGRTHFICEDGMRIKEAITQAIADNEPRMIRTRSVGRSSGGIVVAEFFVTWSFKAKR